MPDTLLPHGALDLIEARIVAEMLPFEMPPSYVARPIVVVQRPVRLSDANRAIGLFLVDWMPQQETIEMHRNSPAEPVLSRYQFRLQYAIRHTDEVQGRALFGVDGKHLREILYRDETLRLGLLGLSDESLGMIERVKKYGVVRQRFLNNEVNKVFTYMSVTDMWMETETVPV